MTKRIFGGAFLSAFIAVTAALLIVLGAVYRMNVEVFTAQLREETELLSSTLNDDNERNIGSLANARNFANRITYISDNGTVLWDNRAAPAEMENHAEREEFIAARQTGAGTAVRESDTLSERTIYCAKMVMFTNPSLAFSCIFSAYLRQRSSLCVCYAARRPCRALGKHFAASMLHTYSAPSSRFLDLRKICRENAQFRLCKQDQNAALRLCYPRFGGV